MSSCTMAWMQCTILCLAMRRQHWHGCHGALCCVLSGSGKFAGAPRQKNHLIQVDLKISTGATWHKMCACDRGQADNISMNGTNIITDNVQPQCGSIVDFYHSAFHKLLKKTKEFYLTEVD